MVMLSEDRTLQEMGEREIREREISRREKRGQIRVLRGKSVREREKGRGNDWFFRVPRFSLKFFLFYITILIFLLPLKTHNFTPFVFLLFILLFYIYMFSIFNTNPKNRWTIFIPKTKKFLSNFFICSLPLNFQKLQINIKIFKN